MKSKKLFLFVENLSIIASPKQRSQPWDVTIINSKYGQHYLYACSWISAYSFVYEEFLRFNFQIRSLEWVCVFLKWPLDPTFVFLLRRQGLCLSKVYCSLQFWEDICYIGPSIFKLRILLICRPLHQHGILLTVFEPHRSHLQNYSLSLSDLIARMDIVLLLYWYCAGVMVYIVLQCIAGIVIELILYWLCTGILYSNAVQGWLLEWCCSGIVLVLYWHIVLVL